jgi:Protein of unknown function (DUF3891)
MLRLATDTGWWLVTHPDHARLAGAFATRWGNSLFAAPEPRSHVMAGIAMHDDGWAMRDAAPQITREGLPSAFSSELVGKYSAFEEIDLVDYLAVRERAVALVAAQDPYAALLVSLHTYNLLTDRADRATIATIQLPLLDAFLERQRQLQQDLHARISADATLTTEQTAWPRIQDHFRLLQATDNLSLLACVDYKKDATLLHPLPLRGAGHTQIAVTSVGMRHFKLEPYPFQELEITFEFPARYVEGRVFASATALQESYHTAPEETLTVTVSA